jgi:hypothetical protein
LILKSIFNKFKCLLCNFERFVGEEGPRGAERTRVRDPQTRQDPRVGARSRRNQETKRRGSQTSSQIKTALHEKKTHTQQTTKKHTKLRSIFVKQQVLN